MVKTKVNLAGLTLDNPIIAASGTFGYGKEFSEIYDINILGSFAFKGTTVEPRKGNPVPRIAEGNDGILLSVGLQNPGMEHVISSELKEIKGYFKKKVIANAAGFSVEYFVILSENFGKQKNVGIIELNVSCPNVKEGGIIGSSPEKVFNITKEAKKVTDKPIFVKLSPCVTDIGEIAKSAEEGGADGITVANALTGMRIDLKTGKPIIANKTAGYAGKAIFPIALRNVYKVYEAVSIPIIGVGGVSSAEDVIEMMYAGATAVGIGTAGLINPFALKEIIEELPFDAEKYNIEDFSSIIGLSHRF